MHARKRGVESFEKLPREGKIKTYERLMGGESLIKLV
jgi:hypothetical protein